MMTLTFFWLNAIDLDISYLKRKLRLKKTINYSDKNNRWLKAPNENDFVIFSVKRYRFRRFLLRMKITNEEDK